MNPEPDAPCAANVLAYFNCPMYFRAPDDRDAGIARSAPCVGMESEMAR